MARKKRLTSILAATLLALGVTVAAPALAASQPSFTGYDTAAALSESDSDATASTYEALEDQVLNEGQIAVVSYEGGASSKVYIKVTQGDTVIADRLEYDLESGDGEVGLITLDFTNYQLDLHKTYSVAIYSDYDEADALYTGTFTGVWADFAGTTKLIGVHAAADDEADTAYDQMVNLVVPTTYALADEDSGNNLVYENPTADPADPYTFKYTLRVDDKTETSHQGVINFVNDEGTTVASQTEDLTAGESKTVAVSPIVYDADGASWFVVNFSGSVQMSYPGRSEYTFLVKKASAPADGNAKAFSASIRYVDEDGNTLATDKVSVSADKDYIYTPATGLTLGTGAAAREYTLDADATAAKTPAYDADRGAVVLDPTQATDDDYLIVYKLEDSTAQQTYTVNLIKCATKTGEQQGTFADPDKGTSSIDFVVTPDDATATYQVPQSFEADGVKYVPVNGTPAEYTFTYGADDERVVNVYYVPEGYTPEESYDITIQYVNIADRTVITSTTQTIEPPTAADRLGDVSIETPATFVGDDGNTYVRLDGQEAPIQHGYYTSYRTYTVYYRDINDNLNAGTVITRIHTRFIPGTTTFVDEGTTDEGTTTTGANANGSNAIGVTDNGDLVVANGANGGDSADILNGEGQDANTVRIDNNQTPLAGPASAGLAAIQDNPAIAAGIVAAVAAAALLAFFVVKRRRKDDDEADVPTEGEGR